MPTKLAFPSAGGRWRIRERGRERERTEHFLIRNMFSQLKKKKSAAGTTFFPVPPSSLTTIPNSVLRQLCFPVLGGCTVTEAGDTWRHLGYSAVGLS